MPPLFHKHPRLRDHDYTRGTFFVNFNTERRGDILGHIMGSGCEARMELNEVGHIVDECWNAIPEHHPNVRIPDVQFMPDHVHAILKLDPPEDESKNAGEAELSKSTQWVDGTGTEEKLGGRPKGPKRGSLGAIMAVFKSESTKRINALQGTPGRQFWKKGFNERVIREHYGEYGRIAQYIAENPKKWK